VLVVPVTLRALARRRGGAAVSSAPSA